MGVLHLMTPETFSASAMQWDAPKLKHVLTSTACMLQGWHETEPDFESHGRGRSRL